MSNDDLRHTSDDAAHAHSSDAWDDLSQLDIPALPDFGDLPGFADLPELAPLPELDALQESAMPEIVMPDLEMPDLDEFLRVTPPVPTDVPQPDAVPETGSAPTAGAATARTHSASHKAATASSQKRSGSKQKSRPTAATASPTRQPAATQAPQPAITVGPTPARTPRASVPPRQKKPNLLIAFVALIAIGLGASFLSSTRDGSSSTPRGTQTSSSASTQADSEVREHAENLPAREPGYRGSATNTHSLSPQWASGVATAWTLDLPLEITSFGPQMFVEGHILYMAGNDATEAQRGSAVRVLAYDLSGEEPTLLWNTIAPTKNSAYTTYTPAFVSSENQLFFHDLIIDKATGEQTQAPWGIEIPLAYADGILVTCTLPSTCNGWTRASGEWTNLWTTTTISQTSYGWAYQGLGYSPAGTTLSGSGSLASFLVPSSYQETPQIINIHTGEATPLPTPSQTELGQYVEVTTDGFVIIDVNKKQGILADSSGAHQSMFSVDGYLRLPAVSRDGNQPSTADIKTFMTTKTAN